ncbi:WhiB family transcriptional regulator, partial [Cutibacterium acnes]
GQDHGVWGGMSEEERRAIKRRKSRGRARARRS